MSKILIIGFGLVVVVKIIESIIRLKLYLNYKNSLKKGSVIQIKFKKYNRSRYDKLIILLFFIVGGFKLYEKNTRVTVLFYFYWLLYFL